MISITDFEKIEIRIGTVESAEVPSWSHWVMKLTVDFGEMGKKKIFSGIMKFFKPEDLVGKQFPFVVNLEPKRIGPADEAGEYNFSEGMMVMATPPAMQVGGQAVSEEDVVPVLFNLSSKVPNGTKVR